MATRVGTNIDQHNTNISNALDVQVKIIVFHSGGRGDIMRVDPHQKENVPTDQGKVTILVFDPADHKAKKPYVSVTLRSDVSVVIIEDSRGKPKIRKVKYGSVSEVDESNLPTVINLDVTTLFEVGKLLAKFVGR